MKYQINELKGKTFSELENIIQRKNFNDLFWEKHKYDPHLIQEAKLTSGSIILLEIESDMHQFSGFKDVISFFKLGFRKEKLLQIIEKIQSNFSDSFTYFLSEDIPDVSWDLSMDEKNNENEGFVKFKTVRLENKKKFPFEITKLDEYEIIGAKADNQNIAIYPSKAFMVSEEKYYLIEIW